MSKVNKAIGKLRHKIQQAEAARKAANRSPSQLARLQSLNDTLNATVVEQNERMETLADNCRHYRQKNADLSDKVAELEEDNGVLYSQLRTAHSDVFSLETALQARQLEYRSLLRQDRELSAAKLKEAQHYLRLSRVNTIVVTAALVLTAAWPYIVPAVTKLFM